MIGWRKGMRIRFQIKKEDIFFVLFCIFTAAIFALYRCINGDFAAYNGDFQNYNIFRRLLDGQVQYRDFTNYLGNGVVFINFPLICLFDSFGESVFITHFTTSILYSLIVYISFYTVVHERKKPYVITNITAIAAFVILHSGLQGSFYYQYIYDVLYFEEQGVSMRTTRAFLPFMLVGIFYFVKSIIKREDLLLDTLHSTKPLIVIYFVLGFLTIWSNDYGYSCVICFFIIMMLVNIFDKKTPLFKIIIVCGTTVICALLGALLSITSITHGNVMDYFSVNAGIMEDQFWYFGNYYGKYLTVSDIFSDKEYTILTIIFWCHSFCFLVKAIRHEITDDSICKLFLHSTCYGTSLIYVIGSGAHSYVPLELITYILGIGLMGKIIKRTEACICLRCSGKSEPFIFWTKNLSSIVKSMKSNQFTTYVILMLVLCCVSVNIIRTNISYTDKEKIEGLKISSVIGAGLDECAEDISEGNIFSTYAGALEIINDVFQPSGTDYIIHVLGDEQREKYLNSFAGSDCQYVSTLKNEYTPDEYWLLRTNWYFYRELYLHYKPVQETVYSVIWEKSEKQNTVETDIQLNWEYINDSTCRIDVELPGYIGGAYVDLNIKYNTVWTKDRLKNGGMRKVLCVEDGGERYNGAQYNNYHINACYYLKEQTDGYAIPIYVRNGKGYAYISSYPLSCTKLDGIDITVRNVISAPDYPLHVTYYTVNDPKIADDGIDMSGTLLKFDNTEFSTTILDNAGQVIANGEVGIVSNVWKDENYIYVLLDNSIERDNYTYPNRIEVIKKDGLHNDTE